MNRIVYERYYDDNVFYVNLTKEQEEYCLLYVKNDLISLATPETTDTLHAFEIKLLTDTRFVKDDQLTKELGQLVFTNTLTNKSIIYDSTYLEEDFIK